jgi:hypothetical protein
VLPKNVLYYGRDEPLPERIPLRAGPLSLIYEAGDLRYIKLGDREILRRVYVAVRDQNWGTVSPVLSNVELHDSEDSFQVTYDVEHEEGDIDFSWRGTIIGEAQGVISFKMEGLARATFLRNRIGFCVLHPMHECADQACVVETVDGVLEEGRFPKTIAPHQPFFDMRAISHEVVPGLWAEVRLEGDVFEMEDQRNWTDASFKTYCTPLGHPFPVKVDKGTHIAQSVTLTLKGEIPAEITAEPPTRLSFSMGKSPAGRLPRIGLSVTERREPLSTKEISRLRALNLSHLRVDLTPSDSASETRLRQATTQAKALGAQLEIAIHLADEAGSELASLASVLGDIEPPVCTWLVFHTAEKSTSAQWVELARKQLGQYTPGAKFGSGTDAFFTELNRERPPVEVLDLVTYSLNPQVHAFDESSLAETLQAQATTVDSARQFCGQVPVSVSPITLKMRFNPNATGPEPDPAPGELPPQVDVRQMSLFGAGWTAGSIKYMAESGVYSATYYQTKGWRGVMETESGSPLPARFRSIPGGVFPLYHVFADVGEFDGGEVIPTISSEPLRLDGLALRKGDRTRVMVANLTPDHLQITLHNLDARVRLRHLDERNADEAMRRPERYRAQEDEPVSTRDGSLELDLLPFALVRVDSS